MATDTLEHCAARAPALAAAEALNWQASDTYNVLALLDALCCLGNSAEGEPVNGDTVARVAHVAHETLSRITEHLFAIERQLLSGAEHG